MSGMQKPPVSAALYYWLLIALVVAELARRHRSQLLRLAMTACQATAHRAGSLGIKAEAAYRERVAP